MLPERRGSSPRGHRSCRGRCGRDLASALQGIQLSGMNIKFYWFIRSFQWIPHCCGIKWLGGNSLSENYRSWAIAFFVFHVEGPEGAPQFPEARFSTENGAILLSTWASKLLRISSYLCPFVLYFIQDSVQLALFELIHYTVPSSCATDWLSSDQEPQIQNRLSLSMWQPLPLRSLRSKYSLCHRHPSKFLLHINSSLCE